MNIKNVKSLFHVLTVIATVFAAVGGLVPEKYALYVAAGSAAISGVLNVITRKYPELLLP